MERRLAAILAADVVGYSRLMGDDEIGTLSALKILRTDFIEPKLVEHNGRIVKLMGDGALVEFSSVVDAMECAVAIQLEMAARNDAASADRRIAFRIGINIGDIIVDDDDIYGDGVNVAARLERLAEAGGICISQTVFNHVKNKVNLVFEDLGEMTVKNIKDPIRVYRVNLFPTEVDSADQRVDSPSPPLPKKTSVVVLPFENMSGDPEQVYFSDGISEDISTDLSKISALFVIARNSALAYKNRRVNVQEVSRELGVGYVVEGSVRKAGNRVRVTAQLIDGRSGGHLWAERYDRKLTNIFDLQDEIREKIVDALQVKLTKGEKERVDHRYTDNLEAYDIYLHGRDQIRASNINNAQARDLFEKAIKLDPFFASAYAQLSYCHFRDWFNQWSQNPQKLEHAFEAAQEAVNLNKSLPEARAILAWANLWKRNHEQAIAEGRTAISLDPNFAEGYARLGEILNLASQPKEGVSLIKKAMRLDPHFPPIYLFYLGQSYYAMENYEEAIKIIKRVVNRNPDYLHPHRTLAVIFNRLGRKEEAKTEVSEILRINPYATVESQRERLAIQDQTLAELYLEDLHNAGLQA